MNWSCKTVEVCARENPAKRSRKKGPGTKECGGTKTLNEPREGGAIKGYLE
jgi:hypothetical protein